mmetsp:Transcript_21853/g.28315  ORF Transcript_21853/g.28315 Transcript_21853/m.28315 type:complete len:270 (+) Transcript_21853:845-1654(+)
MILIIILCLNFYRSWLVFFHSMFRVRFVFIGLSIMLLLRQRHYLLNSQLHRPRMAMLSLWVVHQSLNLNLNHHQDHSKILARSMIFYKLIVNLLLVILLLILLRMLSLRLILLILLLRIMSFRHNPYLKQQKKKSKKRNLDELKNLGVKHNKLFILISGHIFYAQGFLCNSYRSSPPLPPYLVCWDTTTMSFFFFIPFFSQTYESCFSSYSNLASIFFSHHNKATFFFTSLFILSSYHHRKKNLLFILFSLPNSECRLLYCSRSLMFSI